MNVMLAVAVGLLLGLSAGSIILGFMCYKELLALRRIAEDINTKFDIWIRKI